MSGFLGRLREQQAAAAARLPRWWNRALVGALIVASDRNVHCAPTELRNSLVLRMLSVEMVTIWV